MSEMRVGYCTPLNVTSAIELSIVIVIVWIDIFIDFEEFLFWE